MCVCDGTRVEKCGNCNIEIQSRKAFNAALKFRNHSFLQYCMGFQYGYRLGMCRNLSHTEG